MKFFHFVAALLVCICTTTLVKAAPKNNPQTKGPSGEVVRYFMLSDLLGELNTDAVLKERRRGAQLLSADLDVCHTVSESSRRRDRFVMQLKIEGNRLSGTAQSQEEKLPVTVNLSRKVAANQFTFEGTITRGGKAIKVTSGNNTDISETEFAKGHVADEITDNPKDFTELSPQSIQVRVKRAGLAQLIAELRDQNVKLLPEGLWPDCDVLRSGNHTIAVEVDPERVGALLAKLKTVPGVLAVGFAPGSTNQDRAVRFEASAWRDQAGKLDRDKLAKTLEAVTKKVFSAQSRSSSWDARTGELTIKVNRNYRPVSTDLGLTEIVHVSILVGPEMLNSRAQFVLWVKNIGSEIADEGVDPRLSIADADGEGEDGGGEPEGSEGLVSGIVSELHGQLWDSDNRRWTR